MGSEWNTSSRVKRNESTSLVAPTHSTQIWKGWAGLMSSAFWEGLVEVVGRELGFDERMRLGCCRCENYHEQCHGDRDARVVSVSLNRPVPPPPWNRQFAAEENIGNCQECQISSFGSDSWGARVRKAQRGGVTSVQLCLVAATAHSQALHGAAGQDSLPSVPGSAPRSLMGRTGGGLWVKHLGIPLLLFFFWTSYFVLRWGWLTMLW